MAKNTLNLTKEFGKETTFSQLQRPKKRLGFLNLGTKIGKDFSISLMMISKDTFNLKKEISKQNNILSTSKTEEEARVSQSHKKYI